MKVFNVYDDEWSAIMGVNQVKNFAKALAFNKYKNMDNKDFEEDLARVPSADQQTTLKAMRKTFNEKPITINEAKVMLSMMNYYLTTLDIH